MTSDSFCRFLHRQAARDTDRKNLYSKVYSVGPVIEKALGLDGEFSLEKIAGELSKSYDDASVADYLGHVIQAEAAWQIERLDLEVLEGEVVETCEHVGLNGVRCRKGAVPGGIRCLDHGGSILDPAVRRSVLLVSYAKMMRGSSLAVDALMEVAESGRSEMARVQAAKELLDRVGLSPHEYEDTLGGDEELNSGDQDVAMSNLKRQMLAARERLQLQAVPIEDSDGEFIDAEVIEDDDA